jgi:hypothetical protein
LGGDRGGGFDCLAGGSHAGDDDFVGVDFARGTGAIAVGDLPGGTADLLGGVDLVVVVAAELGGSLE